MKARFTDLIKELCMNDPADYDTNKQYCHSDIRMDVLDFENPGHRALLHSAPSDSNTPFTLQAFSRSTYELTMNEILGLDTTQFDSKNETQISSIKSDKLDMQNPFHLAILMSIDPDKMCFDFGRFCSSYNALDDDTKRTLVEQLIADMAASGLKLKEIISIVNKLNTAQLLQYAAVNTKKPDTKNPFAQQALARLTYERTVNELLGLGTAPFNPKDERRISEIKEDKIDVTNADHLAALISINPEKNRFDFKRFYTTYVLLSNPKNLTLVTTLITDMCNCGLSLSDIMSFVNLLSDHELLQYASMNHEITHNDEESKSSQYSGLKNSKKAKTTNKFRVLPYVKFDSSTKLGKFIARFAPFFGNQPVDCYQGDKDSNKLNAKNPILVHPKAFKHCTQIHGTIQKDVTAPKFQKAPRKQPDVNYGTIPDDTQQSHTTHLDVQNTGIKWPSLVVATSIGCIGGVIIGFLAASALIGAVAGIELAFFGYMAFHLSPKASERIALFFDDLKTLATPRNTHDKDQLGTNVIISL